MQRADQAVMTVRFPAEWEPQHSVQLTWPHDAGDWAPFLAEVEPVFVQIALEVARRQQLLIVCRDAAHERHVQGLLVAVGVDLGRVSCHQVPSNDTWARDHGPITVFRNGQRQLLDFHFDGWGKKHRHALDDRISGELHRLGALPGGGFHAVDLVLEGGALESDGLGTLLAVRRCVLDPVRNPGISQARMEHLGIERFLWLEQGGLDGDDTDGHVDTLARFADPHTILYQACDRPEDPNYAGLKAMEAELQGLRDSEGHPYRLLALPSPAPIYDAEGRQLPASYANFLIINGAVLVPCYADPADALVLQRMAEAFPDREVVAIDCSALILQYGSLHCVTIQFPASAFGVS